METAVTDTTILENSASKCMKHHRDTEEGTVAMFPAPQILVTYDDYGSLGGSSVPVDFP